MQKTNKTSAPIAAAFFIVSLAIMPFSLKAVGLTLSLNPSMSAVVDVWNQVAGSFGNVHQPSASAELLAINKLFSDEGSSPTADSSSETTLLASLNHTEVEQAYEAKLSAAEIEAVDATAPQSRNLKATAHSAHQVKRVDAGSYYRAIQARIEQRFEALRAAEAAQREIAANKELLKGLDKQLAALKLDFKLFKKMPVNRDMKVFVKMKDARPIVAPKLTACDLRRALTGVPTTTRVRMVASSADSFENSEF
jgi:hypothetical protein